MATTNFLSSLFGAAGINRLLNPAGSSNPAANLLVSSAKVPSMAPVATAPTDVAGGGGFSSFFNPDRKAALNDFFTGLAAGQTPSQSLALGAANVAANKKTRTNSNQTIEWLKSKGMDPNQAALLASNPTALGDYLKTISVPQDPSKALDLQKTQLEIDKLKNPTTSDLTEYNAAKAQGFQGSFVDYQTQMKQAGRTEVTVNNGEKLPANYMWVDPANPNAGVKPIPGGPGEQLPAEAGGRIGLADTFLSQAPALREKVQSGNVTGLWDRIRAGNDDKSDQAQTYRQIQSGVDALTRMLTGAGQNKDEAAAYAARYLPSYTDDAASATAKLDQLTKELQTAKQSVLRGRGGTGSPQAPQSGSAPANDPLGIR